LLPPHFARIASMPPGYSSGAVWTLREAQAEHFM
jgi:hypothetical protein